MLDSNTSFSIPPVVAEDFPRLHDYMGLWLMEEQAFMNIYESLQFLDLKTHMAQANRTRTSPGYSLGSIAVVPIVGTMMKHASSLGASTSTVEARRAIRNAVQDPSVEGILLHIDSPGGTVAGTKELGDEVALAAKTKPVKAFVEDLGASAAVWVMSQATEVIANDMALIGSIGTMLRVVDSSQAVENAGYKVHVVKAGEFKGMGTPGTEITDEHLAELQKLIDGHQAEFTAAVSKGRGLAEVPANGKIFLAKDALKLGLIDQIGTIEDVISSFESKETPKMASVAELKEACPGADANFILAQVEADATVEEAKSAYIQVLASNPPVEPKPQGVAATLLDSPPVEPTKSATEEWNELVQVELKKGRGRQQAHSNVNFNNPGLRMRMLQESNPEGVLPTVPAGFRE